MRSIRNMLAAVAIAVAAIPALAGQYSDLWWNPQESGWGLNVVQQDEIAFVTMFVYGPDGKPTWYVASDARVIAYGAGGQPHFQGALYKTEGPWHGGAFDPTKVKRTVVGQVTLETLARDRMRVHYSAEGVNNQVKEVVRLTWQAPVVAATYAAQFILRQSFPGEVPYGTRVFQAEVLMHFDAGQAFMRVDDHLGVRCEYRGPFAQTGKLAKVTGTFTCNGGDSLEGTFEITDFEVSAHGVTGFLRTFAPTTNAFGRFAAVRY